MRVSLPWHRMLPVFGLLFLSAMIVWAAPITKNLVTDYGADPSVGDMSSVMQQAVNDVAANSDGGTVVIPSSTSTWNLSRPIFVGSSKVTVTGQGMGTVINQQAKSSVFLLGVKDAYPEAPLSDTHFPAVGSQTPTILDNSCPTAYGLRTTDGTVRTAGYFPLCPLSLGARKSNATTLCSHYRDDPNNSLTFDLIMKNNGTGVIKGTVAGDGDGPNGNITDPVTIWTIESDPTTGNNLSFKFKVLDANGVESTQSLLLSASPVGQGVLRISVQIDLNAGYGRAWFSLSTNTPVTPVLTACLNLGTGYHFKAFQYGAFRLGAVTDQPFTGTPNDGTSVNGDWTYAGFQLGDGVRYSLDATLGTTQTRADAGTLNDAYRVYNSNNDANCIAYWSGAAPVAGISKHLAMVRCGQRSDGASFYGYWLPARALSLNTTGGTVAVRDMRISTGAFATGAPIVIGEASHVSISGVRACDMNAHGVSDWGCHIPNCPVDLNDVAFDAIEAQYYGKSQDLNIRFFIGRPGYAGFRLVGCRGDIRYLLLGDTDSTDKAYFVLHSGPYGGPLSITNVCFDNEGYNNPQLNGALFYAEPSLNPGPEGNVLTVAEIYDGCMYTSLNHSVVTLADAPGNPTPAPSGTLILQQLSIPNSTDQHPYCLVRCSSSNWYGSVFALPMKDSLLSYGPIAYSGTGQCHIITYQTDLDGLPTSGTWLAGCHIIQMPNATLGTTPKYTTYTCTQTGTYGATPPVWTGSNPVN